MKCGNSKRLIFTLVFVTVLSVTIFGLSLYNDTSCNEAQGQSAVNMLDSLLIKQAKAQDSLLLKFAVIDSIYYQCKSSDSVLREELKQAIDNSNQAIKLQRRLLQNKK